MEWKNSNHTRIRANMIRELIQVSLDFFMLILIFFNSVPDIGLPLHLNCHCIHTFDFEQHMHNKHTYTRSMHMCAQTHAHEHSHTHLMLFAFRQVTKTIFLKETKSVPCLSLYYTEWIDWFKLRNLREGCLSDDHVRERECVCMWRCVCVSVCFHICMCMPEGMLMQSFVLYKFKEVVVTKRKSECNVLLQSYFTHTRTHTHAHTHTHTHWT